MSTKARAEPKETGRDLNLLSLKPLKLISTFAISNLKIMDGLLVAAESRILTYITYSLLNPLRYEVSVPSVIYASMFIIDVSNGWLSLQTFAYQKTGYEVQRYSCIRQ